MSSKTRFFPGLIVLFYPLDQAGQTILLYVALTPRRHSY